MNPEWVARLAAALCLGSRWLSAASLVVTMVALGALHAARPAGAALALSLAGALGAVHVYLALRAEVDRRIFDALTRAPGGPDAAAAAFDQALHTLGLGGGQPPARPIADRARGTLRLVRGMGLTLLAQVALVLAAAWASR